MIMDLYPKGKKKHTQYYETSHEQGTLSNFMFLDGVC